MAARRPEVPGRGRAALLGDDRRPPDSIRRTGGVRREADRARCLESLPRAVPRNVRRGEPQPAAADDRTVRQSFDDGRARGLRRSRHARDPGTHVGEGPYGRGAGPLARDRGRKGQCARPDPGPLDVAPGARVPEAAGPARERGVPRGEAAPRSARQLARAPARGERSQARERFARAADRRRCRATRLRRGLYAPRHAAERGGARAARHGAGNRRGPGRESPAAEAHVRTLTATEAAQAQEERHAAAKPAEPTEPTEPTAGSAGTGGAAAGAARGGEEAEAAGQEETCPQGS